ncbi:GntR family transcriptional regulator [bacterium]|nr:GntR family transcriptional regulator [bacterium]
MNLNIDRKSKLPIYVQMKEQINNIIKKEGLKDLRLPTQRELSENLNISRNTVSMAYAELEKEGIIQTHIGKGTFITSPENFIGLSKREILLRNIEHSVEEALRMEFSLDEYLIRVRKFIKEKKELMKYVRLVFVECNIEQTIYFSKHLRLDPHIKIIPIVLSDVRNKNPKAIKEINGANLIITSFYHLDELKDLLKECRDKIYGISLTLQMNTIVDIARVSDVSSIGIVTTSEKFREELIRSLDEIGVRFKKIFRLTNPSCSQLKQVVGKVDTVISSPQWRKEVARVIEQSKRQVSIIEFVYTPDNTSINNLRVMVLELRKKERK